MIAPRSTWKTARLGVVLGTVALGLLIGSCTGPEAWNGRALSPPSMGSAIRIADLISEAAVSARPSDMCEWALDPGDCLDELSAGLEATLPTRRPNIVCSFSAQPAPDQPRVHVIRLAGHGADGATYQGDLVVNPTPDGPRVSSPFFWLEPMYEPGTPPSSDVATPVPCPSDSRP